MSTENAQTQAALTTRAQVQIALVEHWQRWGTYDGETPEQLRARVDALLDAVERDNRETARRELESRFKPEARKLDRFVAGWLSAAEYLTEEPGL